MNHPCLQFESRNAKDNKCINKALALWARNDQIGEPRRLNWDAMRLINQADRLTQMISLPFSKLLNTRRPIYLELTIEFFASYSYKKPKKGEVPNFHEKNVNFRLGGKWYKWSVAKLGRKLDIYTTEETNSPDFPTFYTFQSFNQREEFWGQIADGPVYNPRLAKASLIRDPLLRLVHFIMANTCCGRMDSTGNCPTPDLLFLYHLVTGAPVNLAARMALFLNKSAGTTPNSRIFGGEYVTQLAHSIGILTPEMIGTLTLVETGDDVDVRTMRHMKMIVDTQLGPRLKGRNDEVWDPIPVLPGGGGGGDAEMHDQPDPPHSPPHQSPPHIGEPVHGEYQHQHHQHYDWPPGIPSYPEFYREFQQMQLTQQQMLQTQQRQDREIHAGFEYIFTGLREAFPSNFGVPPSFPFDYPPRDPAAGSGAGPSSRHDDADDD